MHPLGKEQLGQFWKVVPVKENDELVFVWILPNMVPHYKNSPASYLSHLFGHEGKNSLLSLLIEEGLAESLSSGPEDLMNLFT